MSTTCRLTMYSTVFSSWNSGDRQNNVISAMWKMTKHCCRVGHTVETCRVRTISVLGLHYLSHHKLMFYQSG